MVSHFPLIAPKMMPVLDQNFSPAALAIRDYQQKVSRDAVPLIIALERENNTISRYETQIFPDTHPLAVNNLFYVERILKFLLWQRGGHHIIIGGSPVIGEFLRKVYSPQGERKFDYHFMTDQVYQRSFTIDTCAVGEVPPASESGNKIGNHLEGKRIGFDLGASDRKVSIVVDGEVIFSEEKPWNPSAQSDPEYHYNEIMDSLKTALSHIDCIDAIGGSSAGIYINNRPMVASLYRNVPIDQMDKIHNLFTRISRELELPLVVINDGDVAALAGSMAIQENSVLGIALGSSQAAGYVNPHGQIMGWLNELSFAPIDFNPQASVDEWSGDRGCGSTYLSQQSVFRLAPQVGIQIPGLMSNTEKLSFVQEKLAKGHEGAVKIWLTMGVYLGYAIAHYANYYDLKNVIILGRCTSGEGGRILLDEANKVLKAEFSDLGDRIRILLPDEKNRRVGQAIAAASLPNLSQKEFAR